MKGALILILALSSLFLTGHTAAWNAEDIREGAAIAATDQGVSGDLLLCIAQRESRLDPYAVSPTGDHGPYQFHVYRDGSSLMDSTPWVGESVYDPYASAQATAWLIARGQGSQWRTYSGCLREVAQSGPALLALSGQTE